MESGSVIREKEPSATHGDNQLPENLEQRSSPRWRSTRSIAQALVRNRVSFGVGVFLVYSIAGLIANLPSFPGDASRIATCACGGGKDPAQTVWYLAWTPFALLHGHNFYVTTWINYPVGVNLAQNTIMPFLGLLTTPITLASNAVASENVLRWMAFPLSASAMYYVASRLSRYRPAAFAAGAFYGFSPYMIGQSATHLNLAFVPFPPLMLLCSYEIAARSKRSVVVWAVLLGLFATAQFYVSPEILGTTVISGAIAVVVLAISHPNRIPSRLPYAVIGVVIAGAITYACCIDAIHVMEHGGLHYVGPPYPPSARYNANVLGPISPTHWQWLTPASLANFGSRLVGGSTNVDENGSYLGIPLLVLLCYFAVRFRRSRWLQFSLLLAAIDFVLSLGRRPHVGSAIYDVHLPFAWLTHWPVMRDFVPARIALLVSFFVAGAIASAIAARHESRLDEPLGQPGRNIVRRLMPAAVSRAAGWAMCALVVLSLLPNWPYSLQPALAAKAVGPASLAAIPRGSVVLTYPYVEPGTDQAMVWQAVDRMRFKLIGSYALRRGLDLRSTPLPSGLEPYDVEGILANALAQNPVLIPYVPYIVPAVETVYANRIVVEERSPARATSVGTVENVNRDEGTFVMVTASKDLILVHFTALTNFQVGTRVSSWTVVPRRGEHVVVYGNVGPAIIRRHRVVRLRQFLSLNGVNSFIIEMGLPGSRTVAAWTRSAIGPPNRSGGGAEIWTAVQRRLRERGYGGDASIR